MPNTYGLSRTLGGAIGAIAAVSLLSSGAVVVTINRLNDAIEARSHSNRIIRQLDNFRTAMVNQETGERGFLLTGKAESLEPDTWGRPALDKALTKLHALIPPGSTVQAGRLAEAEAAARQWQTEVGERVRQLGADPATRAQAAAIEAGGQGKQYFDRLRQSLDAIEAAEQQVLDGQNDAVRATERNAIWAAAIGAVLTLAICGGMGVAIRRLVVRPLVALAEVMRRLVGRDLDATVPDTAHRNEIGAMARAVQVFKDSLIELGRTSILRATADTLPALVGYVDRAHRVGFLNGEFGRWFDTGSADTADLQGRPVAEVFKAAPFPGAARELDAALAGQDTRFTHVVAAADGDRRELEAFYRPHRAPDGAVLGAVTLLTDVTDRNRMVRRLARQARDLRRSNEELEQFAYVASHDLKAPLRGIENLVSWIEEDLEDALAGDTRTNMNLLKSRVRRLESLLDDLLAYSRAGRVAEDVVAVDTGALVADLAALVSPPAGFSISAEPGLPTVQAPRAPLTQVFQNLIGNAVKHHDHPATGHVRVGARAGADGPEFTVTDDGPGVPERFRERVFGMFQTLKPRDEVEGSGMGLAIVKKLIDRQGGRIWLADGRDGRGLAVHFTWPDAATGKQDGADG